MKTKTINLYKFSELSEKAKDKAIESLSYIDHDWWEATYQDAETIGLKITASDEHTCKGEFIESAEECAHKIIAKHGDQCDTYKTADSYLDSRNKVINEAERNEDGEFQDVNKVDDDLDDLDEDFLRMLLEDYRIMLKKDYEYLTSREAIIETIEANDYDFTQDGKIA